MSKLGTYTNFRGGVLTRVTGVTPSTIAAWGLEIGKREAEGHPRYDASDIIAVEIMKELTVVAKVMAARAAFIVNDLRLALPTFVERVFEENASTESRRWTGGPYVLLSGGYATGSQKDVRGVLAEDPDIGEMIRSAEVGYLLVLPLRRHINKVILQLDLQLEAERYRRVLETSASD